MMLFVEQASTPIEGEGIFAAAVDEGESVLDTPIEELDLSAAVQLPEASGAHTIGRAKRVFRERLAQHQELRRQVDRRSQGHALANGLGSLAVGEHR